VPTLPLIMVRPPSPRLAEGELTHLDRVRVDAALARRQWEGYVAAFADRGWDVVELDATGLALEGARIEPPGTLDGGDVLEVGDVTYVGRGGRTNDEGIRQLAALVEPYGRRVVAVPVAR
jgi:dimethylargininase